MKRADVAEKNCWGVETFYPTVEAWNQEFQAQVTTPSQEPWRTLLAFKGTLSRGASTICNLFNLYFQHQLQIERLLTYAHLRHDEDVGNTLHQEMFTQATTLWHLFREETAWIEPELLQLPAQKLHTLINDPELAPYRFYLEKIVRAQPHTLDAAQEQLLAGAALPLSCAEQAFKAMNYGDMRFPSIADSKETLHPLTHGTYATYLLSTDRVLRSNAFETMHRTYATWEHTLSELINGQVQRQLFMSRARFFNSALEAALFPHSINPFVYQQLIRTVRAHLPSFHDYLALRKRQLQLPELHLHDLYVPLVPDVEMKFTFNEAVDLVIEAVAPLGPDYQSVLRRGLTQERWVDRYENERKRSGAYSSGCYGSHPYILMNYHGQFRDMMTLAHEAGHSMHSYLAWKSNAYHDASYPIFLAEIASTLHEELVFQHLLSRATTPHHKAYLINQKLEDIKSTVIRQTMFAEFELYLHEQAEKKIPLTPTLLKEKYLRLNQEYFGPHVVVDEVIGIEWARIPHFYYNFYVYQYATGLAAAHAFADQIAREGSSKYLTFLSSGGSQFPLDILKRAGVDMTSPKPVEALLLYFGRLVQELSRETVP